MPLKKIGQHQVAVFKDPDEAEYGGFANTTKGGKYPVKQTVTLNGVQQEITWPSSEHAYHAQKLIELKNNTNDANHIQAIDNALHQISQARTGINDEFLPRRDWDPIKTHLEQTTGLDANSNFRKHKTFMSTVIKLKLEQNDELKQKALKCARQGIMPVEASARDKVWATGPNGDGKNQLGIIILEVANEMLEEQGVDPAIDDPAKHYAKIQRDHQASLAHDALLQDIEIIEDQPQGPQPGQLSTTASVDLFKSGAPRTVNIINNILTANGQQATARMTEASANITASIPSLDGKTTTMTISPDSVMAMNVTNDNVDLLVQTYICSALGVDAMPTGDALANALAGPPEITVEPTGADAAKKMLTEACQKYGLKIGTPTPRTANDEGGLTPPPAPTGP